MRHASKQRASEQREYDPARRAYLERFPYCMCGCGQESHDVHEIASGCYRRQAFQEPCTWLALHRICHDEFQDHGKWSILDQLAIKAICDPDNYDRIRLNEIRGRAEDAISEQELVRHLLIVLSRITERRMGAKSWAG